MKVLLVLAVLIAVFGIERQVSASGMLVRQRTDIIVVHHSETETGNVETFRTYHVNVKKWADIGYHYIICNGSGGRNGEIQAGRREDLQGAHAAKTGPNRNANSVGVCLVGKGNFTSAQYEALLVTLTELCQKYGIAPSEATIQGHHGDCPGPGLNLQQVILKVRDRLYAR